MAICVEFQTSVNGPNPAAAARVVNGVTTYQPLAWQVGTAVTSGSTYGCPAGTHVILTPDEISQIYAAGTTAQNTADSALVGANLAVSTVNAGVKVNVVPVEASPEDYAAISLIFGAILCAAAAIWGVKYILHLFHARPEA